jgi:hypothetical protein
MSPMMGKLRSIGRQLAPLTIGLVLAAACVYQGFLERKYKHKRYREAFPFSHYPMYSGFDPWDYYIYVADAQGHPLPFEALTRGYKVNSLKKKFDDLIDELPMKNRDVTAELARPAGLRVLRELCDSYRELAAKAPIRLYKVDLSMKDGAVRESDAQLAAEYAPARR